MSYPPPPSAYPTAPPPGGGNVRLRGRVPRLLGWIFLAIAIIAFVVGGIVIGTKSLGKVNSFQRVTFTSGSGTVHLDTGKYVGYYEAADVDNSIDAVPNFRVLITDPNGGQVNFQNYGNNSNGTIKKFTYQYNGHNGVAAFQFNASQAGAYHVRIQAVDNLPTGADVAFGRDIAGGTIAGGLLIVLGVLALIAAIVLLIVGYVKRSRHKRELQSGGWGAGPPQGYGAPPAGYQQPGYQQPGYQQQPPPYGAPQPTQQQPEFGAPPGEGGSEQR
jgi:hypothetical protein